CAPRRHAPLVTGGSLQDLAPVHHRLDHTEAASAFVLAWRPPAAEVADADHHPVPVMTTMDFHGPLARPVRVLHRVSGCLAGGQDDVLRGLRAHAVTPQPDAHLLA